MAGGDVGVDQQSGPGGQVDAFLVPAQEVAVAVDATAPGLRFSQVLSGFDEELGYLIAGRLAGAAQLGQGQLLSGELMSLPDSVRAVYVTPSHQDPTGAVMSLSRRKALNEWAESRGVWIIEDDFDSFFSYGTKALPSLLTLSKTGAVIYTCTFWKILYPLSTLSFAVLPAALCRLMLTAKTLTEPNHDAVEQMVLADYVQNGLLEKRVRRLRKIYAERRRTLIYQLKQVFGESITIDKRSPGSQILVRFTVAMFEEEFCRLAVESGLGKASTKNHYMRNDRPHGQFLIDFSQLDAALAAGCIEKFHLAIGRAGFK